jgi:hypothetical protein
MRFPWSSQPRRVRHKPLVQMPFFGREALLAKLDDHLQAARDGSVQYVALAGPAGSGKSALLTEFALSSCTTSKVLLVQLHAGACLVEHEFSVHLCGALREQSVKVLNTLYNDTKRLRKTLAVQWDETEFGHFLVSADWPQFQEQSSSEERRRGVGRADPLGQLLTAVYQHPWAVGAATILDVVTRQASRVGQQEPGTQRWAAILRALQACHLPSETALVLLIDQVEANLTTPAEGQRWAHYWRTFAEVTRESMLPLLVVWAGTTESLQPVQQALSAPDALTVHTVGGLEDEAYQRLISRLSRSLPRPAQKPWRQMASAPSEWGRYPGPLLLTATWMATMAEAQTIETRAQQSLPQGDGTAFVDDLVQVVIRRRPEAEGLFRQLLEICAFLPPGQELTLEDIMPLCDPEALELDPLAVRTRLETLLGECVRYGLLTHDTYASRYTLRHSMIQEALQRLLYPEAMTRLAVARRRRLATAVIQHVRHGERDMLAELTRLIEVDDGEDASVLWVPCLVSPLRRILVQSTKDERQRIAYTLGKFRSPLAVDLLMTMLSDQEGEVRSRAVQSLADLDGLDTCAALLKACRDSNSDVRWIAALALGRIEVATTVHALIEMLTDEDKEVGRIAAQGLGTKGDARAVPHLIAVTRDSYPLLRDSAALALGQLADRRALPALQELLQDTNRQVRRSAEKALAQLAPPSG